MLIPIFGEVTEENLVGLKQVTFSSILCSYLVHFSVQTRKYKKNSPRKKFLIFLEIELSDSTIKIFFMFPEM